MNVLELSEQEIVRRQSLQELRDMGIDAAIVGKAAYTGAMDLRRAVELAGLGR